MQCTLVIGVVVFLYILSYGPAWSLLARRVISADALNTFYRPIPSPVRSSYLQFWIRIDGRVEAAHEKVLDDLVKQRISVEFGNRAALIKMLNATGMTYEKFRQQVRQEIEAPDAFETRPKAKTKHDVPDETQGTHCDDSVTAQNMRNPRP
jgi:hypothetical protein